MLHPPGVLRVRADGVRHAVHVVLLDDLAAQVHARLARFGIGVAEVPAPVASHPVLHAPLRAPNVLGLLPRVPVLPLKPRLLADDPAGDGVLPVLLVALTAGHVAEQRGLIVEDREPVDRLHLVVVRPPDERLQQVQVPAARVQRLGPLGVPGIVGVALIHVQHLAGPVRPTVAHPQVENVEARLRHVADEFFDHLVGPHARLGHGRVKEVERGCRHHGLGPPGNRAILARKELPWTPPGRLVSQQLDRLFRGRVRAHGRAVVRAHVVRRQRPVIDPDCGDAAQEGRAGAAGMDARADAQAQFPLVRGLLHAPRKERSRLLAALFLHGVGDAVLIERPLAVAEHVRDLLEGGPPGLRRACLVHLHAVRRRGGDRTHVGEEQLIRIAAPEVEGDVKG